MFQNKTYVRDKDMNKPAGMDAESGITQKGNDVQDKKGCNCFRTQESQREAVKGDDT